MTGSGGARCGSGGDAVLVVCILDYCNPWLQPSMLRDLVADLISFEISHVLCPYVMVLHRMLLPLYAKLCSGK